MKTTNKEIDLMLTLKEKGIEEAVSSLSQLEYEDYCLFLADIAESVLHIYENSHHSDAPREAIQAIRDYKQGNITEEDLKAFADAARTTTVTAADNAATTLALAAAEADACATAYACAAYDAATTYTYDAYNAYAGATTAAATAATACAAAYAAAYAATTESDACATAYSAVNAMSEKWEEIEQLFIKHFGDTNV